MKEIDLIKECKKNNYAAQMQVYHLYKNRMYNSSWRLFKNKQDAEDAVHDAFIKGFQKIDQLKNDNNLGAWLNRIVINRSLDILRSRNNIWAEDQSIEHLEYEQDYFDEDSEISIDFIKKSIEGIAEKYRVILILYLIENYNHREISDLLNLKESTVRNQYIRGKAKLLDIIQKKRKS